MAPTLLPELHLLKQVKEVSILMRNLIAQFVSETVQEQRLSDFSLIPCPTLARLWTTLSHSNGSEDNSVTMGHMLNYATPFSSVLIHNTFKIWCSREFPVPESFIVGKTKLGALPEFSGWVTL